MKKMKCKVNGKILKGKIESVLLKGKWNNGGTNKNSVLCPTIVFSVDKEGNNCILTNGNPSTYITNSLDLIEMDETKSGRVALDSDILLKYLPKEDCIFQLKNNNLQLVTEKKSVSLPILDRHENNDSILFVEKNLKVSRDTKEKVIVSSKTQLETRIKVSSDELSEAFSDCEAVGNSVYKLDYDGERLTISSSTNTESVSVNIEPVDSIGVKATMEFSAPFFKYLEGRTTILSFNDESPLSVISGNMKILRAPRIEA
tara:strand:+ start:688 stop:1461 length:774 start_codon:yes stop_codon:yes gene_type:complete